MKPRNHRTRGMTLLVPSMVFATAGAILIYSAQPQFCSSNIDIASYLPGGAHEDPDVRQVNADIDATFSNALIQATSSPPADQFHQRQPCSTGLVGGPSACSASQLP